MKSKGYAHWLAAALGCAAYAAWALLAASLIRNQGDNMIGFHPIILAIFPGVLVGAISAVILIVCRQWQIGLALALGSLTLFLVLRNGRAIEERAWQNTIISHAQGNEKALATIQSDLNDGDLSSLWEEEKLSPMQGFQWYGTNHFSAPNGVYFGFRIDGVPHARIQKIRHGWRGIALGNSDSVLSTLPTRTGMTYARVGSSNWFTWSTE